RHREVPGPRRAHREVGRLYPQPDRDRRQPPVPGDGAGAQGCCHVPVGRPVPRLLRGHQVNRSFFVVLLFVSITVAGCAQNPPEANATKDGKFSLRFPSKPKETTQTTKTDLGELSVFTATYATSDSNAYMVSYTDFPPEAAKPENRTTLFDGMRDELKGEGGK